MCTVTSAESPGLRGISGGGSMNAMRTGTRCTTLTKLPVALSGGKSEKTAPVPPDRLSTFPKSGRPLNAATRISARWPGRISPIWVQGKATHLQRAYRKQPDADADEKAGRDAVVDPPNDGRHY